jgi:hypothetical protein
MGKSGSDDASRLKNRVYEISNVERGVVVARSVRLAGDSATRRKGLLGVSEMDENSGLWISPCEAVHTFGMRIPIDVLFIDREHRVRKISRAVKPNRIAVSLLTASVVELRAGRAFATGTEVGDQLIFQRREG